ncbi:MAG: LysR family transcriptional regulator [Deltaproteobacteria bacterium]|nr:LysR family transcriptional regulator [Deltaproteobacteria bacterium]
MDIRQLRTFRTVARLLNFNRAAEQLHYAQSSISAQIQSLEEELGVPLFDRLGRRVILTEAGLRLLNHAEKIVNLVDETLAEMSGSSQPQGSLTIRIPESFGVHRLPPVIREFHSRFPNVQLNFITCTHEALANDLRKGLTDLAFLLTESIQAADLVVESLGCEHLVLVAGPDCPLALKPVVQTADLAGKTFLFSRVDCSYRRIFEKMLDQAGVAHDHSLEFYSVEAMKRSVMAGVGLTILPEVAVADDLAQCRLLALPWVEGRIEVAILMIRYQEKWLSPSLKAFMDITRKLIQGDQED